MPNFDMPLEKLQAYDPPLTREPDFEAYWERTLAESAATPLNEELRKVDYPALGVDIHEIRYDGWRGARICAWYLVPHTAKPHPAMIQYHGYSGAKVDLHSCLMWALQGYATLAVDTRGQSGHSTDPGDYADGHVKGWMTKGIMDPERYYYRGAFVDCVRAIDFCCSRSEIDSSRIGITGMSQGGALTVAVAGLDRRPAVAIPEMPYLCHYRRAVDQAVRDPYLEICEYLKLYPERWDQVWRTLSYCDNMNLAPWITCPVLMDVGLLDDICPPSSIYATFNKITSTKEMVVFPYHNHAAVPAHYEKKFRWAHHYLKGIGTP